MYVQLISYAILIPYLCCNIERIIDILFQVDIEFAYLVVLFLVSRLFNIICSRKFYLEWVQTVIIDFSSDHVAVFDLPFLYQLLDNEEVDVFVKVVRQMKLLKIRLVDSIWH